jgi:NADH:ubiquinone oxidoreductase subunit 5 (subunit L)/multisubunit Na+/H+ antiporter MnhA subunit
MAAVLENKFYFDEVYQWAIDNLVLRFASMVAWFDRHIVNDTGINGPGDSLRYASFWTKFHVTGRIPDYALLMIVGIASAGALGFLLR